MTDSRKHILSSIRQALESALLPGSLPEHPVNVLPHAEGGVDAFILEVERLSGQVIRAASAHDAARRAASLLAERGWHAALAWEWEAIGCPGLAQELESLSIQSIHEGAPASLAGLPVGLTGAEAGLADTGTIVVRNGPGRSPLASLLPPVHVAMLDAARIFPDMRAYLKSLPGEGGAADHVRGTGNLVFITGPSRTADIEQTLTLGVHGPRELIVVVWG